VNGSIGRRAGGRPGWAVGGCYDEFMRAPAFAGEHRALRLPRAV